MSPPSFLFSIALSTAISLAAAGCAKVEASEPKPREVSSSQPEGPATHGYAANRPLLH